VGAGASYPRHPLCARLSPGDDELRPEVRGGGGGGEEEQDDEGDGDATNSPQEVASTVHLHAL
jgi:hypothetical protein